MIIFIEILFLALSVVKKTIKLISSAESQNDEILSYLTCVTTLPCETLMPAFNGNIYKLAQRIVIAVQ